MTFDVRRCCCDRSQGSQGAAPHPGLAPSRRDAGADGTGGAQALALAPAQGGFVELTLTEPGHYPFVSHVMVDAERGAHGLLSVGRPRAQR